MPLFDAGVFANESANRNDALAPAREVLQVIFDSVYDAIFIHGLDGQVLKVNEPMLKMYGVSGDEALSYSIRKDYSSPDNNMEELDAAWRDAVEGRERLFEWNARRPKDGTVFPVEVFLRRIRLPWRDAIIATVRDITVRRKAAEQLKLSVAVFENSTEGIVVTDADSRIRTVNPGFTTITGYEAHEVIGHTPRLLKSDRHERKFYEEMWKSLSETGQWRGEIWNRRKSGEAYPEWMSMSAIRDSDDRVTGYVSVFHDLTEVKRSEEWIARLAYHDALTDLPNRLLFMDRLQVAIAQARREGYILAVIYFDLDRFKNVNDSLGHPAGDQLLRDLAARLSGLVRAEDTAARLGGDEFILLLHEIASPQEAAHTAQKVLDLLSDPFRLGGQDVYMGASIGVSIFPSDGADPETLVKNAELAMYRAKDQGRNSFMLFTPDLNERVCERLEMESSLRRALERDEFRVFFQPRVALDTGCVLGMEALLRWEHPERGLVSPVEFIPLAEETGIIVPLGEWALRESCRRANAWLKAGYGPLRLAVNLSARQLDQADLMDRIKAVIAETGFPPEYLELEITESILMGNIDRAIEFMRSLSAMGIRFSMDDFGTGYSSLYYLRHLPLHTLKIDRSFIKDLRQGNDDAAIVSTIVSMAQTLALNVVAEGVETEEQLDFLISLGTCDEIQGYLFSRPLPPDEFERLLAEGRRLPLRPFRPEAA